MFVCLDSNLNSASALSRVKEVGQEKKTKTGKEKEEKAEAATEAAVEQSVEQGHAAVVTMLILGS